MTIERVIIAAHYASTALGGEAAIPVHLFRQLRERDVDVWLVSHDSGREELTSLFRESLHRLVFTPSLPGMSPVFTRGERLPDAPRTIAWGLTQIERQAAMIPAIRSLVRSEGIQVVHLATGVAPGIPSPIVDVGAPVVVGPLNGHMSMPRAFYGREPRGMVAVQAVRPVVTILGHSLMPGKRDAAALLVANERTRESLPSSMRRSSQVLSEIGVVLPDWSPRDYPVPDPCTDQCRFVFLGRLVGWKAVDLLLQAMAGCVSQIDATLEVIGDGPERSVLEASARRLGLSDRVTFSGWLSPQDASVRLRSADVFVLPSLREAGGAAVLEAMATALPVIVADRGGPAEIVDDASGIRVDATSREGYVHGLTEAMVWLAADSDRRRAMGHAGRRRVEKNYAWAVLAGRLIEIYEGVVSASA